MSELRRLLFEGTRPVLTAELPPVSGGSMDALSEQVARLAPYVDALNATDNTAAHAHPSNVALAIAIKQLGVEPILQVVCRDKNRLALQADIMGAALHGVTTIGCLTGDDVTAGDEPEAPRVFDLDAPQLLRTARSLSRGHYLSGRTIDPAPDLFLGAVENPGAPPYEQRVRRGQLKATAGARFLQLQICYFPDRLAAFTEVAQSVGLTRTTALLPTVCLVRGARALQVMDERVPGIEIPPDLMERVANAGDQAEAAYVETLHLARHALSLPGVRGLHVVDFRRDDTVARLRSDLGLDSATATALPARAMV